MIRIVIADDHELIRQGIKKILRASLQMRVVGEASDLGCALELVGLYAPDVLVLDLNLPGHDGLEGLMAIRRSHPDQKVVLLSMYAEAQYAVAALGAGAGAYVSKALAAEELVRAISHVVADGVYMNATVTALVAQESLAPTAPPLHQSLTARESEILRLIGAGLQVKQVAGALDISVSSVNTYRNRIFRKMGLNSNASVIRYALKNGLVS
ncbi:MAG: uncharacterized protein JWP59_1672 [Massilia sp.]|jgi:two-component system invasion response regulator UvrY|nr:uncharacterized protein [Massilia sp.]